MSNPPPSEPSGSRRIGRLLSLTTFLSAALLFAVEPMAAKFVLPWFGGSAAVWTTAMLFFQAALLAGYLYAFALTRYVSPPRQKYIHLALILAAILCLPAIPPEWLRPADASWPIPRLLAVLAVTIGVPFGLLCSTASLTQTWWHRLWPASSPYRLYAMSNLGSLAGLLAYPLGLEPLLGLHKQAYAWSAAVVLYGLLCGVCTILASRVSEPAHPAAARPPREFRWPLWLLWPALSSMLLLAITAILSQQVAPIPLLWILPLSIYLLSFALCFEYPRAYCRPWSLVLFMVGVSLLCATIIRGHSRPPLWQPLTMYCLILGAGCMLCHGQLFGARPAPSRLTLYYLLLAAGSVIGGASVAVVAPLYFKGLWELHLSLAGILLLTFASFWFSRSSRLRNGRPFTVWFLLALWSTLAGMLLYLDAAGKFGVSRLVGRYRDFYGTIAVRDTYEPAIKDDVRSIQHNGIVHGIQARGEALRRTPLGYYALETGIGRVMRATESIGGRNVGVVGLGAGAMAAWARSSDHFAFYEISPEVMRIASTDFTYLADAPVAVEIFPGDARITLQSQSPRNYDLLIVDAFSGDAIPVHLMTREALDLYARHLTQDGLLVFHITNRYVDLEPALAATAEAAGWHALTLDIDMPDNDPIRFSTRIMVLSRNLDNLNRPLLTEKARLPNTRPGVAPWSDDYSNILQALK